MDFKNYSKTVLRRSYKLFIVRAWPVWGTPLAIYFTLCIPYLVYFFNSQVWNANLHLRISGFLLQLLFVVIVVIDLFELIEEFERPSLIEVVKNWCKDFSKIFRLPIIKGLSGIAYAQSSASAKLSIGLGNKDDKLEKRVELLEKRLKNFQKETNNEIRELNSTIRKLESTLKAEMESREHELEKFKRFVERISTSGFKCEGVALIWLVTGLLFSIFPNELKIIVDLIN